MSIVSEFWNALEARDWGRFGATVADDVVGTWPQSRERITGRDALIHFMATYPGDWHLAVAEAHVDDSGAATRIEFTLEGHTVPGLTFFHFTTDGRIASFTEFWPEPYDVPAGRAGELERY